MRSMICALLALGSLSTQAQAREIFPTVDELRYENGRLSVSVADGCNSRTLQVQVELGERTRGPSPVNPKFEIWHQTVLVSVYTDDQQDSCRVLSYSTLQDYPLAETIRRLLEGQEIAALHVRLPEVAGR